MKIEREQIVDEALRLLDDGGLDQLTTRRLAERLGVQQPSLYYHFRNKQALVDALNARLLATEHTYRLPAQDDDWASYLFANAKSFRRALLSHRDGARVHAGSHAAAPDLPMAEAQLKSLNDAGFPADAALQLLVTLSRFTVGSVLEEQAELANPPADPAATNAFPEYPYLSAAHAQYWSGSYEANFEAGLRLILDGARAIRIGRKLAG
ncbi:TetR/AcrR family transcriptional regulator C-terminal domain-containing protein [Kaistia terrae]|uniref:TetR/AcrR family transcriptional regulator C-terminal domain-containing protein n=1 Tax=Kaistia terrae TaxID=537017 RepID=A0ABW0Q2R2_9HYPH|nr:TetR/AcrR family transcriptional regulator C-terminal domain-containing protein [Kaistia terrae]MCX5581717.1 TetR/AcrR family transcriptional regulator C-terminal domain-containing protein [Kaistia terrae]